MKKISFHEYLDSKDKLKPPVVTISGDVVDPPTPPVKPPHEGPKYKCSDGKPKKSCGEGFAKDGDKSLIYNPGVDNDSRGKAPAKIPTVRQVEVAQVVASGIEQDPSLLETIVRQLKHRGLLGPLVAEVFEHREACASLAQIMSNYRYGPKVWTNLATALHEEVAEPFSAQLNAEDDEESDDDPTDNHDPDDPANDWQDPDSESDSVDDPSAGNDVDQDPATMGQDPGMAGAAMGMDPNMMAMGPGMDPNAALGAPQPPMAGPQVGTPMPPPQNPMMSAMQKFQRAMMRSYQRAMMRKNMRKR